MPIAKPATLSKAHLFTVSRCNLASKRRSGSRLRRAAADELRLRLASSGQPLVAPHVETFESFATAILEHNGGEAGPEFSLRMVIEEVAKQMGRDGRLDYFRRVIDTRGFVDSVVGLIQELELSGIPADQFSAAIADLRSAKLAACATIYGSVIERLGGGLGILGKAATAIGNRMANPYASIEEVRVEGFVSFSPVEWRLLEAIAPFASIAISLPSDDDQRPEAFATIRATRARLAELAGRGISIGIMPGVPEKAERPRAWPISIGICSRPFLLKEPIALASPLSRRRARSAKHG